MGGNYDKIGTGDSFQFPSNKKAGKKDKLKEAIVLVLKALHDRLPKSEREGFLLDPHIRDAVKYLDDFVGG